jgi:hypothetical protein
MIQFRKIFTILSLSFIAQTAIADEGMYPLSEIAKLKLKEAGLQIPIEQIYNPNGTSLIDALVNVGGCTGSFVSAQGLIITNHHCAFGAVQQASTPENDYLTNGFVANAKEQELEAKDLTCRITLAYKDVSAEVLKDLSGLEPAVRLKTIEERIKKIEERAKASNPELSFEVSEMFIGKSYILFTYQTILDVRIVYVPNRQIGEFGGETDNWVWPRHTGDFSFLRAYMGPDGKPAKYSKNNVPYSPKKFLNVNASGIKENDFVFILGYPGRTFRNRPAVYVEQQYNYTLPYISDLYTWQNNTMEELSKGMKEVELAMATKIKRNANVLKNYQGKMLGLERTGLINEKKKVDQAILEMINNDLELKKRYGTLFLNINELYEAYNKDMKRNLVLNMLTRSSSIVSIGIEIEKLKQKLAKTPEAEKEKVFEAGNKRLMQYADNLYQDFYLPIDMKLFGRSVEDASKLAKDSRITAIDNRLKIESNPFALANLIINQSEMKSLKETKGLLNVRMNDFVNKSNAFTKFCEELLNQMNAINKVNEERDGKLNQLMGDYIDVKQLYAKSSFIPDANSTLRFTYGYIKGARTQDGLRYAPITSIRGILEKGSTDNTEYAYPKIIKTLYENKDWGTFKDEKLGTVPVAFLYNLDTTGGNSGSPIMDANGNLIGVNFDRSYEATINDYAWNKDYSRSIGVDIRYVLWVAQKVDKANMVLSELGIN